ncbi:MAG: response regulator [Candidatus Omnitrophica bacterium]|nr:response regulator [Candidatus Omnitrophota bacterium]
MASPKLVAIDDEVEFTRTIDQFFSARGYEVHVALTGTSGLELVDYHKPDVVLVDLKLPGMDGDELLQRIRRAYPTIPVIVITAYNDGGKTRDRLLALGAFAHFDKPISSLRDLAEAMKRGLANRAATS